MSQINIEDKRNTKNIDLTPNKYSQIKHRRREKHKMSQNSCEQEKHKNPVNSSYSQ